MKKFIAFIFFTVFLFSVLPVRELGKLMSKGQTTEEVHNDDVPADNDFGGKIKKEIDPFIEMAFHTEAAVIESYNHKVQVAIQHGASVLPDHFVPRIPTPPPNFC